MFVSKFGIELFEDELMGYRAKPCAERSEVWRSESAG
jgi:hypothetical protein